jgi:ATP synthase protein I
MNEQNDGKDSSFEQRLQAARQRRGLEPRAQAGQGQAATALGVGMRVGVELVSAMVVAVAIGWALDRWLHTSPAFLVLFVLLGFAAGLANLWRVMGPGRMPGPK